MEFSFRIIKNCRDFEDFEPDWQELISRSETKSIYLTWEWMFAWWQSFGSGCELRVICVSDSTTGQVLGIAPLCIQQVKRKGVKLAELTFLNNKLTSADHLDFIVDSQFKNETTYQLVNFILMSESQWDVIRLGSVSSESFIAPVFKELVGAKQLLSLEISKCPYIQLPDNFQDLYQSLSKKKRKNARRYRRAWENYPEVTLLPVENENDLRPAIKRFIQLNIARQQEKGKRSTLESEEFQNFIALVSLAFLRNGWLRMYKMVLGEKILGIDYGFQYREKLFAYSGGYEPEWSHLNPGHVMLEHSIKQAINEKIIEYDLLGGDQSYKYDWANSYREDLVIKYPISPKGKLLYYGKKVFDQLR